MAKITLSLAIISGWLFVWTQLMNKYPFWPNKELEPGNIFIVSFGVWITGLIMIICLDYLWSLGVRNVGGER